MLLVTRSPGSVSRIMPPRRSSRQHSCVFFSSRRRHTRLQGDWSSDVCSSDLVLRFQASWCKPCVTESAALARVAERYRARGVEVLALHVQDTTVDAQRFVSEQNVTYPVALDPRLTIANRFGFNGTPYTVVVDRRGEMVARIHGESAVNRLPRILDGLVGRAPRAGASP